MGDREPVDETIARLARLFREHPAWTRAAAHLARSASSTVYFSHLPGEPWHLRKLEDGTRLLPGAERDPDFVFRFTPESIDRLEAHRGSIGDFAVALFTMIDEGQVELRVVAGFARLVRRGYVELLLAGGPAALAYAASLGIASIAAVARLVRQLRTAVPRDWET